MELHKLYTFVSLYCLVEIGTTANQATSHKIMTLFTKLPNTDTHLENFYSYDQNMGFIGENEYSKPTPNYYFGSAPNSESDQNNLKSTNENTSDKSNNKREAENQNEKTEKGNGEKVSKQELSKEASKLEEEVKSMEESKDKLKELESQEKELSEQLGETNYEKLSELVKKRNILVNKISEVAKTLRRDHDSMYPELRGQPIVLIAKSKDDEKRKANQLAHLEGFEDFMNHITSPCNMMEQLRQRADESSKSSLSNKFETEQKILDSMSLKERLNYDRNMIEHYESIMREIDQGLRKAEDEIVSSWNHHEGERV